MTETDTESRPLRADARRNRERILGAAQVVFAEYGTQAQMDDVAQRAEVGVGTVYRHFPTKEALMGALVRETFRQMTERVRAAAAGDGEPFAVLAEVMRQNAEEVAEDAVFQETLAGFDAQIWIAAEAEQAELLTVTGELVDRARREGTIRADAQATDVAMLMCSLCSTMAHPGPGFDWRRHLELVIDALRPVAEPPDQARA